MPASLVLAWHRCSFETKLSLAALLIAAFNLWLGVVACFCAAAYYSHHNKINLAKHQNILFFAPLLATLISLAEGISVPYDDLMRHLRAWTIGYDYRPQYPWSDLPKTNLWIGFDMALGGLQQLGIKKEILLVWVPGVAIVFQQVVLFFLLKQAFPKHRRNVELFLIFGAIGLLVLSVRPILGRPDSLILTVGAAAALARNPRQAAIWCLSFLLVVPVYWLGWVYAPCALLLAPKKIILRHRILIAASLGTLHVLFWHLYSGDYIGLMIWLKGTLSVLATENYPLLQSFKSLLSFLIMGAIAVVGTTLNKRRAIQSIPHILLVVWFCIPNQIRYYTSIVFVLMPWAYYHLSLVLRVKRISVNPLIAVSTVATAMFLTVAASPSFPTFKLAENARVYSESPYATVFYGKPGIAVEPSFAFGATKPEWRDILTEDGAPDCQKLVAGKFTHIVEKSITALAPCLTLTEVQGAWRLWTVNSTTEASDKATGP